MSINKRRILFLDRDGTLIIEPEDFQIDSLQKLDLVEADPRVSIIGSLNACSHCPSVTAASGAEAERAKRNAARRSSLPKS